MILYESNWSLEIICRCSGSVFPKACFMALTSAALAVLADHIFQKYLEGTEFEASYKMAAMWSGFTFVLGFLVVFRTQQAYGRYWEGASLLRIMRSKWFHAVSNLISFCNTSTQQSMVEDVAMFQNIAIRLMSLLYVTGLQSVADFKDDHFAMIDVSGMEMSKMQFLANVHDKGHRCEILLQWLQQSIMLNIDNKVLSAPPPIIGRVFQELGGGLDNLVLARQMTQLPFPFPYAQMLSVLLILHLVICPCVSIFLTRSLVWSCILTFLQVTALWGINYIAAEIESPFGRDANDLDLEEMAEDMNDSLFLLLEPDAQCPPKLDVNNMCSLRKRATTDKRISTFQGNKSISKLPVDHRDALQKAMDAVGMNHVLSGAIEQPKDLEQTFSFTVSSQPKEPDAGTSALVDDVRVNAAPDVSAVCESQVQAQNVRSGVLQMENVEKMLTSLIAELVELRVTQLRSSCEVEDFNPPRTTLLQQAKKKILDEGTSAHRGVGDVATSTLPPKLGTPSP